MVGLLRMKWSTFSTTFSMSDLGTLRGLNFTNGFVSFTGSMFGDSNGIF